MKTQIVFNHPTGISEQDWIRATSAGGIEYDSTSRQYRMWWVFGDTEEMGGLIESPEYTVVTENGDELWRGYSKEEARKVKSLLKGVRVPSLAEGI